MSRALAVKDWSVYLVTDSTAAILGKRNLVDVVRSAVQGGVAIVQYRDKKSDTGDLIRTAQALHRVTAEFGVPLIINDRVDVAIATKAEGVHLGQTDMDIRTARSMLGPAAIIGATVSSKHEALMAILDGADYLGIGTVFSTPTKEDTQSIIGISGVREILQVVYDQERKQEKHIPCVAIGGLNASNIQRFFFQSQFKAKETNNCVVIDGVAVVSAIIAAEDPKAAARELQTLLKQPPPFASQGRTSTKSTDVSIENIPQVLDELSRQSPLCHNMTNLVVQNFAASVATAIGASPIMSNYGAEAEDLAAHGGALVINMGTVTPEILAEYTQALKAYNAAGGPVLFDPVGAGATGGRRNAVKTLMAAGYFSLIKGNEDEIRTVLGTGPRVAQKGVDSGRSTTTNKEKASMVRQLAERECNVVLMTGAIDFLSDGDRTYEISSGHEYLGMITGSGCTLGTTVAACLAVWRQDPLLAALAGVLLFEIAAERAAARADVKGPGTFVPAFVDELENCSTKGENGYDWLEKRWRTLWPVGEEWSRK
ncbi:MAG: hypothetical protein LQ351_002770 [Letrouitia transgressa]|nr:MAG: hypothetical protein LQ351_002770 [Letrouitia transgressa]